MNSGALSRLRLLVDRLRTECPWDREQTFATLSTYLLEECHETVEALDRLDAEELRGELGDLLFQLFFLSRLASERGWFDIEDVAEAIERKMIERHPHVFGGEAASDAAAVAANWERRKRRQRNVPEDPLHGVPASLPALATALRISARAADLGFDWERDGDLLSKIVEEISEVRSALDENSFRKTEEEYGDLLFALANWGRRKGLDPERCLRLANDKFRRRFARVAAKAREAGGDVADATPAQLDAYWNEVKKEEA